MKEFYELARQWREMAASPFVGADDRLTVNACADDLERALRDHDNALLSPNEAAAECGLKPATVRKKLGNGDWPNEGTPYRPKVRRRALREAINDKAARKLTVVR